MLDLVILSNAKTPELEKLTSEAIKSCLINTNDSLNIFVVEHNTSVFWEGEQIIDIHPEFPFNYNEYANIGASSGSSDWICIANNDLIFMSGWFDELMKVKHSVMSPKCPKDKRQADVFENEIGDQVGRHLSGWCFVIKRSLWEEIGGFDEDFSFWCADNSLMEQLHAIGIRPMVVAKSLVEHLGSQTLKTVDDKDALTRDQVKKYNRKYNRNLFGWGI